MYHILNKTIILTEPQSPGPPQLTPRGFPTAPNSELAQKVSQARHSTLPPKLPWGNVRILTNYVVCPVFLSFGLPFVR